MNAGGEFRSRSGSVASGLFKFACKHAKILFKDTLEWLRDSDIREQAYVGSNERVVSIKTFLFSYRRSV